MFEEAIIRPLSECLAVIRNGIALQQVSEVTEFPVTRIETIADGVVNFSKVGYLESEAPAYKLKNGDILYSHINSYKHVGKIAQYEGGKDLYHGMNLLLLRPNDHIDPKYLYYALNSSQARSYAQKESQKAINQVSVNVKSLGAYELYVPPMHEQKNIATILDTLDTQIRQTEAIIAKLQQVKQGLLHDLLTRGIDENGQLRPPYEQAPELYKDSPLGWIPKEWEVNKLGNICSMSSGGTPSRATNKYWGGSIPWVKTGEVKYNVIYQTEEYITKDGLKSSSARLFPEGALIMAIYGEGQTRGRVAILGIECATNQACVGFQFDGSIKTKYIYHYFYYHYSVIRELSNDGSQKNLSSRLLKEFLILHPSCVGEQERIVRKIESFDNRLKKEREMASKLKKQKAGLMDDLLTGRVRVTELIEQEKQAS